MFDESFSGLLEAMEMLWEPFPKQVTALERPETEILYGGARGGGKTDAGIAWLLKWKDIPQCRALVLRLQANDLRDWSDRAYRMFAPFGAIRRGRIPEFVFPSGFTIWTGHLQDDTSWANYQGFEIQKLLFEELTQIPNEKRYLDLLGSLRSTIPDVWVQAFLTCNPGGPGHEWVHKRFIKLLDAFGKQAIPGKTIFTDKKGLRTRIFIPATVEDNPRIEQADPGYIEYLNSLPDGQRQAWRFGDWDAFKGQYFSEFRKKRLPDEPEEALHVIPAFQIPRHCPRWIGWDWGYSHDSAVYWLSRTEDSRIHVYREIVASEVGAEEFGVKVAEASLDDLEGLPDKAMTIYLSPDAFHRRDSRNTIAQQIEDGMSMVLGADSVFLADYNEDEREMGTTERILSMERRRAAQKDKTRITIERANNDRIGGWNYLRKLMRWKPLRERLAKTPDEKIVREILTMEDSTRRYAEYMLSCMGGHSEVLPRLQIHDCCSILPDAIMGAIYDERNPEDVKKQDGDDKIDALRYGVIAHKKTDLMLPKAEAVSRKLVKVQQGMESKLEGTSLFIAALQAEKQWKKQNGEGAWLRLGRGRNRK